MISSLFAESSKRVAAHMAGQHGIEKTPREWQHVFHSMIADYRVNHPDKTLGKSNAEVWTMVYYTVMPDKLN